MKGRVAVDQLSGKWPAGLKSFFRNVPMRAHLPTILLASCMFFTGAAGLVVEYILSTVSTYILGNSIEQFVIIIALMLLMMGVAGSAQNLIGDRGLVEKFILIEILLAWLGGFAPIAIYAAFGALVHHFQVIQYFFVISIGLLIGFEIPLVLRINERYQKRLGANIASIYTLDYVGAFVGAVAFNFLLLKIFPLTEISFIVAGLNFFVATLAFWYFWRQDLISHRWVMGGAIVVTVFALGYGYLNNRGWNQSIEQRLYNAPIVLAKTTSYQRLVLTYSDRRGEYRFFINGNLQFSSRDESIYHEQLVHPAMALVPDHRRVLILGGGDGLALREVLKYPDVEEVTLVELDPEMIELFSTNSTLRELNNDAFADARVRAWSSPGVQASEERTVLYQESGETDQSGRGVSEPIGSVEVYTVDADRFIADVGEAWNVIFIDLPDPSSVELAKLYSKEFYLKLHPILAETGVVALQATSPYHATETYLGIQRTMEAAGFRTLPYHDNVPSFGDWGWLLGWKNETSEETVRARIERLSQFQVETDYLTPEVFRRALVFGKNWLESRHDGISTLMDPKVLYYYLDESWIAE